jgi:hypothetical protein
MAFIITADRASDITDFVRGCRYDRHVIDYRRVNWLAAKHSEFDQRAQAVREEADRIIAEIRARRAAALSYRQAAE